MRDGERQVAGRAAAVFSASAARVVCVAVTDRGFEPDRVVVGRSETVELIFTRIVERPCLDTVVISLDAGTKLERVLPTGVSVTVTLVLAFHAPGELEFACLCGLHTGLIEGR